MIGGAFAARWFAPGTSVGPPLLREIEMRLDRIERAVNRSGEEPAASRAPADPAEIGRRSPLEAPDEADRAVDVSRTEAAPDRYFVPAYLGASGWVGLRLDRASVSWARLTEPS